MEHAIQKELNRHQTAMYSFYGAIAVALFVVVTWWMVRPQDSVAPALQRRVTGSQVTWRCPDGHSFKAKGSYQRISCPQCTRRADIAVTYRCPNHGTRDALIRIEQLNRNRERLSEVSFRYGVWRTVNDCVHCPDCGLNMSPQVDLPFQPRP